MTQELRSIHTQAVDFWLARASVVLIALLQISMINDLTALPRWTGPVLECALLLPLSVATAWTQANVKAATTDRHWQRIARERQGIRVIALMLTGLITAFNFIALFGLIADLLQGSAMKNGQTLLLDAVNIFSTNVIIFALWFWSIDRGGPAFHGSAPMRKNDFLFPQMTYDFRGAKIAWCPGFIDYLYLSFTNATAFSPTDTAPLTRRAKLLMMIEAAISLLTIALVAARAVNILA